ncbi:MAG: sigma-70 factor domain-containing protein [Candidatus Aminicenantaceae bacterium]
MTADFNDTLQSRNLKLYLKQISNFMPLDQEEEKKLGVLIQAGDQEAVKRLIESNLKFVVSYVKNTGAWASASRTLSTKATWA